MCFFPLVVVPPQCFLFIRNIKGEFHILVGESKHFKEEARQTGFRYLFRYGHCSTHCSHCSKWLWQRRGEAAYRVRWGSLQNLMLPPPPMELMPKQHVHRIAVCVTCAELDAGLLPNPLWAHWALLPNPVLSIAASMSVQQWLLQI